MFTKFTKYAGLAAVSVGLAGGAANAAGIAYMDQQSTPVYWSSTGSTAVLVLQYDLGATVPLTVKSIYIGDVSNNGEVQLLDNCGTPIKNGDAVVAYSLAPGQHCFLQSSRTVSASMYGEIVVTDGSTSFANMQAHVRAMIETRDASNNVLTHVELR